MKKVDGMRIGNVVNFSIDGKLQKKVCSSDNNNNEAKELFAAVLLAKEDPSDANIRSIRMLLNERTRVALMAGLETDLDTGLVFLEGFNTPIPDALVEIIKDYHENNYPLQSIKNFWKLLMANPDERVRTDLFDFIKTHDFVLTEEGYMLVYKAVAYASISEPEAEPKNAGLDEFVSNQWLKIKKDWKCSPNKYTVYEKFEEEGYFITKNETFNAWDLEALNIRGLGKVGDLYAELVLNANANTEPNEPQVTMYTDKHTHKMQIQLGVPVKQARKDCDANPKQDCSNGLHCGATKYVENFANSSDAILVCLVNPMNVVAVPEHDNSKFRTSEYYPLAKATYINKKIEIVEQPFFECDYVCHEKQALEELIAKIKKNEVPFETAMKAKTDERPMSELQKIIESRLIEMV